MCTFSSTRPNATALGPRRFPPGNILMEFLRRILCALRSSLFILHNFSSLSLSLSFPSFLSMVPAKSVTFYGLRKNPPISFLALSFWYYSRRPELYIWCGSAGRQFYTIFSFFLAPFFGLFGRLGISKLGWEWYESNFLANGFYYVPNSNRSSLLFTVHESGLLFDVAIARFGLAQYFAMNQTTLWTRMCEWSFVSM